MKILPPSIKFQKGFTLVELLIAVGIIAILSALVITAINPGYLRSVARDSNRKKDIQLVGSALEQYYADNNSYPDISTYADLRLVLLGDATNPTYMRVVPKGQPDPGDAGDSQYCYFSPDTNNQTYYLCTALEVEPTEIPGDAYTESDILNTHCDSQVDLPGSLDDASGVYCATNPF